MSGQKREFYSPLSTKVEHEIPRFRLPVIKIDAEIDALNREIADLKNEYTREPSSDLRNFITSHYQVLAELLRKSNSSISSSQCIKYQMSYFCMNLIR